MRSWLGKTKSCYERMRIEQGKGRPLLMMLPTPSWRVKVERLKEELVRKNEELLRKDEDRAREREALLMMLPTPSWRVLRTPLPEPRGSTRRWISPN
ncbi:hypothetical protein ACSQ67_024679 [Phaseolus vulgaris]